MSGRGGPSFENWMKQLKSPSLFLTNVLRGTFRKPAKVSLDHINKSDGSGSVLGGEEEKERAVTLLPRVGERKKNGKEKERKV